MLAEQAEVLERFARCEKIFRDTKYDPVIVHVNECLMHVEY